MMLLDLEVSLACFQEAGNTGCTPTSLRAHEFAYTHSRVTMHTKNLCSQTQGVEVHAKTISWQYDSALLLYGSYIRRCIYNLRFCIVSMEAAREKNGT